MALPSSKAAAKHWITSSSDLHGLTPDIAAETDSVAGVRGLELANVALQADGPNSLVFHNIFVPETFRENCERADRPLGAGLGAATVSGLIALDFQRKESVCPESTRNE